MRENHNDQRRRTGKPRNARNTQKLTKLWNVYSLDLEHGTQKLLWKAGVAPVRGGIAFWFNAAEGCLISLQAYSLLLAGHAIQVWRGRQGRFVRMYPGGKP